MTYKPQVLRKKRVRMGISVSLLAHIMGVSKDYLAKLETGEIEPVKEQLEVINDFLEGDL